MDWILKIYYERGANMMFQPCCALTGEGVQQGVQWLSGIIKEIRK